jgi:hypothetical protein
LGTGKDFIVSLQKLESYKDIVGTVIYPFKEGKSPPERRK